MRIVSIASALMLLLGSVPVLAQSFELSTKAAGLNLHNADDHNGVSVADYDMDGDLDIYMVAHRKYSEFVPKTWNKLFRNEGDGTFSDATEAAGVQGKATEFEKREMGSKFSAVWGDYDNDGDPDLFLTSIGPEILYRNEGDGTFSDVTEQAGLMHSDAESTSGATWWDYDRDGDLDLYVTVWGNPIVADSLTKNRMYENRGDGTFEDVSISSGLADTGKTWASIPIDANNDGLIDLYVVNDYGANKFYLNKGDKSFEEATAAYGLEDEGEGMGVTIGDYNNDGFFDIYVTNTDFNPLFLNTGEGGFTDEAEARGVQSAGWAWGTEFFDCDHDGDVDLYVANGFFFEQGTNFFFANQLSQKNEPSFTDISEATGANGEAEARGLVVFDYDNDGDLDMLVANWGEYPYLYTNTSSVLNWLKIELEGTESNRNAFGATVHATVGGKVFHRHNDGVEFLGQSVQPVHLGVGYASNIDEIEVRWPSGRTDKIYNVAANQTIKIIEGGTATSTEDPSTPGNADAFQLFQPYPNPFAQSTALSFQLPQPGEVNLTVYNILGQEVLSENYTYSSAGKQSISLNGESLGRSGMYIYRMVWGKTVKSGVISRID